MEWKLMLARAKPRVYIFAFVFIIVFHMTICHEDKTPILCYNMTTPGITYPHGDIIIEKGSTLEINCSFYEVHMKKHNTSYEDLYFIRNNETVPREWVRKINESTIQLYIKNMPRSKSAYTCKTEKQAVCMNIVIVDTKPTDVSNFKCISYNYENLTCTWIAPEHYVKTTYNLFYYFRSRSSRRAIYACPNLSIRENLYSCFWDLTTRPHYRQSQPDYFFNLSMSNKFGEHTQSFTVSHFANVIPDPPENLKVLNKTSNSVALSWTVKSPMNHFPAHVIHRLVYQSEFDNKDVWHVANTAIIDRVNAPVYNLTGLKYAHVLYDIRISMRSSKAREEDEQMWSKNVSVTVRTESTVPGAPPEVNIGSFEIVNNRTQRDIYVYWKSIPEHIKNGENFSYKIITLEKKIEPIEITNTYARFVNLNQQTHKFQVFSMNEVGRSVNNSLIVVPSLIDRLPEPISFTKISYGNQVYELSWNPPESHETIESYTIFYCRNDYDRPFQCKGYLQWVEVEANVRMQNITVPEDRVYQFAISANSKNSSSGMVWASCTVIHDKEFTKMKKLWINNIGSNFIDVGWKLDCSDRIGSIEGFIIYYCPIVSPVDLTCYGEEKNVTLGGESIGGKITHLKPYTTYMLTVSVKSKHNNGLPSDPLYNTTLEAAPDPPENVTVTDVTSNSITVRWSPPKAYNGVFRFYEVSYSHDGQETILKPENEKDTNIKLANLSSFTEYTIKVYARTAFLSNPSETIRIRTAISVPGRMRSPNIKFQNESTILVAWVPPEPPGGRVDKYQLCVKENINFENHTKYINTSDLQLDVPNCGTDKAYKVLYFSVRAINYDDMKTEFVGDWSSETENYCQTPARMLIWILIAIGIAIIVFIFFFLKKIWYHCQIMRDVEVKLPPGLAPPIQNDLGLNHWPNTSPKSSSNDNTLTLSGVDSSADEEHLLSKKVESGDILDRIPSGDSSGCSSGHESVTSSLASGTNMSSTSDSGTEQPRTPSSDSVSRENSLRQRKTGSEANWDPEINWIKSDYVLSKPVAKTTLTPQTWTVPKVPTTNYCVLGVDNVIQQPDLTNNSGYVPVPLTMPHNEQSKPTVGSKVNTSPPYVTCDTIFNKDKQVEVQPQLVQSPNKSQPPAYVKTSDAALLGRPAHLQQQQPAGGGKLVVEQQTDPTAVATAAATPGYVMAGAPITMKGRLFGKANPDLTTTTGKLINIEPLNEVETYMQHSSDKNTPVLGTTGIKGMDDDSISSPRQPEIAASLGYVKTEDILGLKAGNVENRGNRSRRGSDETTGQHQTQLQLQQSQLQQPTPLNPYCRLGWDKNAGVETESVPATPVLKKGGIEPSITKGYVPHRQFENKSLKED